MRTAGGHLVTPSGTCTSCVTIDGTTSYPAGFVILSNSSPDVILGNDILTQNGAIIDVHTNSITFSSGHFITPEPNPENRAAVRIADGHVTLPPRANLLITVYGEGAAPYVNAIVESDQRLVLDRVVSVARGMTRFAQRKSHVLVTNFTEEYQHLNYGSAIVFLEKTQEASDLIAVTNFECVPEDTFRLPHPST